MGPVTTTFTCTSNARKRHTSQSDTPVTGAITQNGGNVSNVCLRVCVRVCVWGGVDGWDELHCAPGRSTACFP